TWKACCSGKAKISGNSSTAPTKRAKKKVSPSSKISPTNGSERLKEIGVSDRMPGRAKEDPPKSARGRPPMRAAHDAPRPSGLSFHLARDVAQDSGSSSDASRSRKIRGLAEVPFGAIAIRDENGV